MDRKKDAILKATAALTENYKNEELFMPKNGRSLPSRAVIIDVVKELRAVIFPGYFWSDSAAGMFPEYYTEVRFQSALSVCRKDHLVCSLYNIPETCLLQNLTRNIPGRLQHAAPLLHQ